MSELNGIYVDANGDIKCRLGDSGYITITDLPTDDDYEVSIGVFDPKDRMLLNETSINSDNASSVEIPITTEFTKSLGVGRYFYGIKLTDGNGEEQTVLPGAIEDENGKIIMNQPNTFTVRQLLAEGGND